MISPTAEIRVSTVEQMNEAPPATAAKVSALFATGVGQSDTHAIILSDGTRNPHPSAGMDYNTISARTIAAMMLAPQEVPKAKAHWFMPSTYIACDARNHEAQRERGSYWWFCVDIDKNNLSLLEVQTAMDAVAPEASRLIYSTRSSTPADRRWRALLPLSRPLPGSDYTDMALAFFALLDEASKGVCVPDRKLALTGQLVYLPNRGEHYEHEVLRAKTLNLLPDHPVTLRCQSEREAAEAARREAAAQRAKKAAGRPKVAEGATLIDRFNAANRIGDLLDRYGYMRLGQTDRWQSPHQTSGSFATRDFGDHWVSLSGSDADLGLGSASARGDRFGDAFDLYVAYEHGGDPDAAIQAFADECDQHDVSAMFAVMAAGQRGPSLQAESHPSQVRPENSSMDIGAVTPGELGAAAPISDDTDLRLPTPFQWIEPALIPPRPWLYGRHLLRQQVSVTVAPGGLGKSSNSIVEALAMASGRPITGEWVKGPLRVWVYNLEDPSDELQRRVTAAMIHHRITPEAVGGRLFIDSGRDRPLCAAKQISSGTVINVPELDAMSAMIKARNIDALIIDPFVSSHQVNENDNGAIDLVAKQYWAVLAQRCNCAIELVHHTRKLGGEEGSSESARGASALLGAARSGRVLNSMSTQDRERAGISATDTSVYFALVRDKANLAPPGKREWRRVVSVDLGNGDSVGVVEKWDWPDDFAGIALQDLQEVQRAIDAAPHPLRYSDQAAPWAGDVVAEALGLDVDSDRKRIKRMIETWLKSGALLKQNVEDGSRQTRPCIQVGDRA